MSRPDHSPWARLLDRWLVEGRNGEPSRFDYAGLRADDADRQLLRDYIVSLEAIDPATLDRPEAFAFWANLYNALTVELVVSNGPVGSIRDLAPAPDQSPWSIKLAHVAGQHLSLDDIEHTVLRQGFGDRRVHYALNCASASCPNLAARPFEGDALDRMLDEAARTYVNSPRGARLEDGRLVISSIFKWYRKDFGGTEEDVFGELRKYADPELAAALDQVSGAAAYDYDWQLNGTGIEGEKA